MSETQRPQSGSTLVIASQVSIPRRALQFSFSRSGGPGGQAVNKISTRAQLRVNVSDITGLDDAAANRLRRLVGRRLTQDDAILIEAETHRSQRANKDACIDRLTALVRAALVKPKVRKKKKPTRAMIERRLAAKRATSEKKRSRSARNRRDIE